jgi:hypothetical protein
VSFSTKDFAAARNTHDQGINQPSCFRFCNNVGMVPALFEDAEKDALLSGIREARTAAGLPDHKEACWATFVDECRNNLHVVLAMSPVGETLRTRCRNFPGMVNNTVIDWFEPWPEQVSKEDFPLFLQGSVVVGQEPQRG